MSNEKVVKCYEYRKMYDENDDEELLKKWIESYDKNSNNYRVLIGKYSNLLKLMKKVRVKAKKEVINYELTRLKELLEVKK